MRAFLDISGRQLNRERQRAVSMRNNKEEKR
jgi:hypothetical protein